MPNPARSFSQRPYVGPPGSTELLLVRHGASADAVEGETFELVEGQGDPPLSDVGRHQAERVALRLAQEPFDALYVTTLRRTAQTAAPLVARCGMTPVVEADLREVFLGEWEGGQLRQKAADQDPLWDEGAAGATLGRGARRRVAGGVRGPAARAPSSASSPPTPAGRVVAFSHGAAIGEILAQATSSAPFAFVGADNASISKIVVHEDRWVLRGYNDTAHLTGE